MATYFFRYKEPRYYGFGLRLGLTNLFRNGFSLGWKRTLSLIAHPIPIPSRFPEYCFLEEAVTPALASPRASQEVKMLDVSSPKCFGLYLAYHFPVEAHLTDLYEPAFRQAEQLWSGVKHKARGRVEFCKQDARRLSYPENSFDIVFSMSVVEHIEGSEGDTQAIREMARVLKPGGVLAVSVPFGERYQEQEIVGVRSAADRMKDGKRYFFQRIYSRRAVEDRILAAAPSLRLQSSVSVARRFWTLQRLQARLGTLRIALGFLFPVLSSLTNSSQVGIIPPRGSYGPIFRGDESYGDLVLVWRKSASPECTGGPARGGIA